MLPAADNPSGFWESQPLTDLNDEILRSLESEWDDVFGFGLMDGSIQIKQDFARRAAELLQEEYQASDLIVLKDPRVTLIPQFWDEMLREAEYDPHYIIMTRNPLEVADSLRTRDGFPMAKSLLLWASYMVAAERGTRGRGRTFLSYDQLISDWDRVRRRIETDAALRFPVDAHSAELAVNEFINRKLRHCNVSPEDLMIRGDVPEEIKTLYGVLHDASEGDDLDIGAIDDIEARLTYVKALAGGAIADLRARARVLVADVTELNLAHAGARGQADMFLDQLAAERARHADEIAAASRASADHEKQIEALTLAGAAAQDQIRTLVEQFAAERAHREDEAKAARQTASDQARQIAKLGTKIGKAETQRAQLIAKFHAEQAKGRARDIELRAMAKEAENARASAAAAEKDLAHFASELDKAETEIEEGFRIVEWRAGVRISELEAEIGRLSEASEAHRLSAEATQVQLNAERHQTIVLRSAANAAETKLLKLEQTLDEVEDEVEQTLQDFASRLEQGRATEEARLRSETRRREEVERLYAESEASGRESIVQEIQQREKVESLAAESVSEAQGRLDDEIRRREEAERLSLEAASAAQARLNDEIHRREELEGKYEDSVTSSDMLRTALAIQSDNAKGQVRALVSELADTKASLAKIRGRLSWRLTAPLRRGA